MLRVRERKLPKWYWCDPGLVRAMKRSFGALVPEERGALFEGLVAQLLRAYRDYRGIYDEMYYWAPSASMASEVDFILVRGGKLIAIEAKSGASFSESWCKGLRAAAPLNGLQRRLIVYPRGPALYTKDGIEVLPFKDFTELLASGSV
jgi:predicted AAA+ superfamily ATPase